MGSLRCDPKLSLYILSALHTLSSFEKYVQIRDMEVTVPQLSITFYENKLSLKGLKWPINLAVMQNFAISFQIKQWLCKNEMHFEIVNKDLIRQPTAEIQEHCSHVEINLK